jgi:hypothetical protein
MNGGGGGAEGRDGAVMCGIGGGGGGGADGVDTAIGRGGGADAMKEGIDGGGGGGAAGEDLPPPLLCPLISSKKLGAALDIGGGEGLSRDDVLLPKEPGIGGGIPGGGPDGRGGAVDEGRAGGVGGIGEFIPDGFLIVGGGIAGFLPIGGVGFGRGGVIGVPDGDGMAGGVAGLKSFFRLATAAGIGGA